MFSKWIKFFTRGSFFKKLYLMTMGIVFVILFSNFLINFFFLDKFYIYQKKKEILKIKNKILKSQYDYKKLEEYIDFAEDNYGVKINIDFRASKHKRHNKKITLSVGEHKFKIKQSELSNVTFITYTHRYNSDTILTIRTSLAVISQYVDQILIFNIITAILTLFISGFIISLITKKINANIEYLKNQAKNIEKMDYPVEISLKSGDELEELAISLNSMSKQLYLSTNNLKLFVSNASHELKTPISILCLYSQALVLNKVTDDKRKEYYKVIFDKSLEMKELTESLLTLSKINSPTYKISNEIIDIKNLILNSLENYDYLEFKKNLEITTHLEDIKIVGDINLIKIAVNNIVQNMLKYSNENGVASILLNKNIITFKNSIFSSFCYGETLFEPFKRGENALNEKIDGNGLGLALVKRVLELHKLKFETKIYEENKTNYFEFNIYL